MDLTSQQNQIIGLNKENNVNEINNEKINVNFSSYFVILFWIGYELLGIIAFIWSILCFDKKGSLSSKIFGFFIALLLGPFYFIYYYFNKKYCRK